MNAFVNVEDKSLSPRLMMFHVYLNVQDEYSSPRLVQYVRDEILSKVMYVLDIHNNLLR